METMMLATKRAAEPPPEGLTVPNPRLAQGNEYLTPTVSNGFVENVTNAPKLADLAGILKRIVQEEHRKSTLRPYRLRKVNLPDERPRVRVVQWPLAPEEYSAAWRPKYIPFWTNDEKDHGGWTEGDYFYWRSPDATLHRARISRNNVHRNPIALTETRTGQRKEESPPQSSFDITACLSRVLLLAEETMRKTEKDTLAAISAVRRESSPKLSNSKPDGGSQKKMRGSRKHSLLLMPKCPNPTLDVQHKITAVHENAQKCREPVRRRRRKRRKRQETQETTQESSCFFPDNFEPPAKPPLAIKDEPLF